VNAETVTEVRPSELEVGQAWCVAGEIVRKSQIARVIVAIVPGEPFTEVRWTHVGHRLIYWCSREKFAIWINREGALRPLDRKSLLASDRFSDRCRDEVTGSKAAYVHRYAPCPECGAVWNMGLTSSPCASGGTKVHVFCPACMFKGPGFDFDPQKPLAADAPAIAAWAALPRKKENVDDPV
jgi:hypothetical protein